MAAIEVPASSTETLYVAVRANDPILGDINLSSLVVEVACPTDGVAPSTWVTTTWSSGTLRLNGNRYYLAKLNVGPAADFALTGGTTYRAWARVTTGGSNKAMVKGSQIVAVSS